MKNSVLTTRSYFVFPRAKQSIGVKGIQLVLVKGGNTATEAAFSARFELSNFYTRETVYDSISIANWDDSLPSLIRKSAKHFSATDEEVKIALESIQGDEFSDWVYGQLAANQKVKCKKGESPFRSIDINNPLLIGGKPAYINLNITPSGTVRLSLQLPKEVVNNPPFARKGGVIYSSFEYWVNLSTYVAMVIRYSPKIKPYSSEYISLCYFTSITDWKGKLKMIESEYSNVREKHEVTLVEFHKMVRKKARW